MEPTRRYRKVIKIIVSDPKPVLGTLDIADRFDMTRQGMGYHLDTMVEEGLLNEDKVGKTRVFWPTQDGLELLDQD